MQQVAAYADDHAWVSTRGITEQAAGSLFAPSVPAVIWVSEQSSFSDTAGFPNACALVQAKLRLS